MRTPRITDTQIDGHTDRQREREDRYRDRPVKDPGEGGGGVACDDDECLDLHSV